jgi:putative ABC transport system permease protein
MDMTPPVGKTYIKTLIREIRQSMGRFLAIFAIVALGVGFLAGILQSTPDMRVSVDSYYRKNSMADIFIKSTMGLTEGDLKEVSSLEGIESVMPAYVTDVIMDTSRDESLVTRVYGLPLSHLNEEGFVNSLTLAKGRLPQKQGECLVQEGKGSISQLPLGTVLTISRENPGYENMNSTFSVMEYTVVGIVENPFYISVESEPSTVGNGRLGAIVYTDEASYSLDVYTDFYITLSNTDSHTSFTPDYEDYAESFVDKLDFISKERCSIRYASVMSDAKRKLDEGRQSCTDAKQEADYMANGEKELSKIEYPKWYVLDRNSNVSYASYKVNVKKVEEIAKVFPIFFLLVASSILKAVSLISMASMLPAISFISFAIISVRERLLA